jgi:hypothetical protein
MHATLSNFYAIISRMLKKSAGILPALSGILPDSIERALPSHPTLSYVVRRQHAGRSGQNARAPQS